MNNNTEEAAKNAAANLDKDNLSTIQNDFVIVTTLIPVNGNAFVTDSPNPNK